MRTRFSLLKVAALSAAFSLALPVLASAQQPYGQPSYAQPPPSYGNQQAIKGTISGFDGQWVVYMHDEKGYTDHITLHQGTIINPTGIKLLEGMQVTVYGYADGPTFQANAVNVAYSPYSPYYGSNGEPAYGYDQGYGYGYGYPAYGYPGYGYGAWPWFGVGINWGWGWGWGWPGYYGYPGYCCGYGGYYGYPYRYGYPGRYYYPGRGYTRGTITAPPHGTVNGARPPAGGTVHGGGGSVHGGGGGRP
jgi:hypothetical protein